jgi:hypothetical protein
MKGDKGDTGATGPAGSGALRVVDASGTEVGLLAPPNGVIRDIDGTWVLLALGNTTDGFAPCSTMPDGCGSYLFAQPECQGPAYTNAESRVVQDAKVIDGEIRFPVGRMTSRVLESFRDGNGDCWELGATQMNAAEMKSVPVSSLGLAAPFHVAR